jgi:hypothetical protein
MVDDVKIGLRTEFEDDASARVAEFRSPDARHPSA